MVCSISCFISIMFLVAMIYCNIASYKNNTIINYRNQLPTNLKNIYDKIVIERLKIYESLEYRRNNSKERIDKERKIATEFLRSILQRKQQLINERKVPSNTEFKNSPKGEFL